MPVPRTPNDRTAAPPPLQLLARARRAAAHDVNNLLAVIQGNAGLLPMLAADQAHSVLVEIELACERLALVCDAWLLADPDPPPAGQRCVVAEVLQQVACVLRAAQAAEIDVACAAAARQRDCGIDARTLRALVHCALVTLLRSSGARSRVGVRLAVRGGTCTVHLRVACAAERLPRLQAPGDDGADADACNRPIACGLWDVAQCLQRRGGGMRHAYSRGVFHLRLDLPAPAH